LHIPGHSPGSIVLYSQNDGLLITGDVLFNGSIGRTDLPGGDYDTLIRGITEKLMVMPPETRVYPGHGPITTIGLEHDTNPFLRN
jgi:glyoxylase-like metal-dependent hydrolase (beta-lactamase superfamily II)